MTKPLRFLAPLLGSILLLLLLWWIRLPGFAPAAWTAAAAPGAASKQYLPVLYYQTDLLCRFGVNGSIAGVNMAPLKAGWFVDYQATAPANKPKSLEHFPVVRLWQTGPSSYDYAPKGSALTAAIAAHPGAYWLIGNEPDRRGFQDDLEPQLYAAAYRNLYQLIKAADPTARILAGTIVQPTALRLKYLDLVLTSYQQAYGSAMPVDGWSIHNFILNEVSCDYDPANCWGAGIPPGLNDNFGEILKIEDNDNIELFKQRIVRFRQWMKDRGYAGKPLHLTEYGVLMPQDFGFTYSRVNQFMTATFNYLRTATDPVLGDPNDGFRLVQRWSWYSTLDQSFNGWLFDPTTKAATPYGANFAAYTAGLNGQVDYYPVSIGVTPINSTTYTITTQIANAGNTQDQRNAVVSLFVKKGTTETKVGSDQVVSLAGCGANRTVSVRWENVQPGAYIVTARITTSGDVLPGNNELAKPITIN